MYGALILQGITPGPLVFTQQGDMITGLYITLFICSIFMLVLGKIMCKALTNVLNVPKSILFPIIMIICFAGSYSMNNTMYDVLIMIIAGVFGYVYKRIDMPIAPTLIGFILGTQMERSLLQSLIKGGNKLSIFVASPISIAFVVIIVLIVGSYIWKLLKAKNKGKI
jgi:putative tricarboxylic transport membrane protein